MKGKIENEGKYNRLQTEQEKIKMKSKWKEKRKVMKNKKIGRK